MSVLDQESGEKSDHHTQNTVKTPDKDLDSKQKYDRYGTFQTSWFDSKFEQKLTVQNIIATQDY